MKDTLFKPKFYVRKVCMCEICSGTGFIVDPIWDKFYEDNPVGCSRKKMIEWFREHGYDEIPEVEVKCDECNGTGFVEDWVDLEDAIAFITNCCDWTSKFY